MDFFIDFAIFALLVVGITAVMGSIGEIIGRVLFGKNKNEFVDQDKKIRLNWKKVERKAE